MGVHGVLPEEQVRPQPFEVDVELLVDLRAAGASDDLADTVDYGAVSDAVSESSRRSTTSCSSGSRRGSPRCAAPIRACRASSSRCASWSRRCPAMLDHVARARSSGDVARTSRSGSNLGDRAAHLQLAVDALAATPRRRVRRGLACLRDRTRSAGRAQDAYLNAVVAIDTDLDPHALLALAQRIEDDAHRVRVERWGPRTLDVDVLLYDDVRLDDPDLTLPHPRMWERGFVLAPLRDVAPGSRRRRRDRVGRRASRRR